MVTTSPPPPTKMDRECGAAVRTVRTEVGRTKKNGLIGEWEKGMFLSKNICKAMSSSAHSEAMISGACSEAMPSSAHSAAMPLSAHNDQTRHLNNT